MKARLASEDGHAIIELSLVLPLLLLFGLASIELARALRDIQLANVLSRELANRLYRECIADPTAIASQNFHPQPCVDEHATAFALEVQNIAPGTTVLATMFTYDQASNSVHADATMRVGMRPDPSRLPLSKVQLTSSHSGKKVRAAKHLVVGEVFIPYDAIFGNFAGIFEFDPQVIYAATVI